MKTFLLACFALGSLTFAGHQAAYGDERRATNARAFRFTYRVEIKGLAAGDRVRGWIPEPIEDRYQSISLDSRSLPGNNLVSKEKRYGNMTSYFETTVKSADSLHARVSWDIVRRAANPLNEQIVTPTISDSAQHLFLSGNKYVPVGGEATTSLLRERPPTDALKRGEFLFDLVADHMKYDKSRPGYGNGDAVWACDSRFGNCTDFHSLFISLARGLSMPARFEIGFSIPAKSGTHEIGGYHCWAYFSDGKQWVPVDISEGDKHPDQLKEYFGKMDASRVAFTTGRDLILEPAQDGDPINFLIYPYVEVNGKAIGRDQIVTKFTSTDQ